MIGIFHMFISFYRIHLRNHRYYIKNLLVKIVSYPVQVVVMWYLWQAILEVSSIGISVESLLNYYLAVFLVIRLASPRLICETIERDVISGDMIIHFVRPIRYWVTVLAQAMASFTINIFFVLPVTVLILSSLGHVNVTVFGLFGFLVVSVGGILMQFCIYFVVGLLAFWLDRVWSVSMLTHFIISFMGGSMIPLYLFPEEVMKILQLSPFHTFLFTPIQMLLTGCTGLQIGQVLLLQLIWMLFFVVLAGVVWRTGRRHFTGYGV